MPVITVASPKGGAGKSTASVILGTELANAGASVTILDCDPNKSVTIWADRAPLPPRIQVQSDVGESDIVKVIKQQDATARSSSSILKALPLGWCLEPSLRQTWF